MQIYEALAIEDVGAAADLLRPVYDHTGGTDGFVSIDVSPELAYQTDPTIDEARRFWGEFGRPNVMIKVPATLEGIPVIERLTAEGVNVNITLIFAVDVYQQVMDAYLKGLERRIAQSQPIDRIASVASFFVSRVDTLVDNLLEEKVQNADEGARQELKRLAGKAAVANAKIASQRFEAAFGSDRFKRLEQRGAQIQRPLWAPTSTKNPAYPNTMYVDPLVGPRSVNTMTLETIEAYRDHGKVECNAIQQGLDAANQVLHDLERVGISMKTVTDQLTEDGVRKFAASLHALLNTIQERQGSLVGA